MSRKAKKTRSRKKAKAVPKAPPKFTQAADWYYPGQSLAQLIDELAVRVSDVALESGISRQTIYDYIAGKWAPRPVTAVKLAKALKVSRTRLDEACKVSVAQAARKTSKAG